MAAKSISRKVLSVFMSIVMVVTLQVQVPRGAFADEGTTAETQETAVSQQATDVEESAGVQQALPESNAFEQQPVTEAEEGSLEQEEAALLDGTDAAQEPAAEEADSSAAIETAAPAEETVEPENASDASQAENGEDATELEDGEDAAKAEDEDADKAEDKEVAMPAFAATATVDGVKISVSAPKGTFPEGASLEATKVGARDQNAVDGAVEAVRDANVNVAASYTFDIKVLDKDGKEVQPADGKKVNVSFALAEVANQNLDTGVYHVSDEGGALNAEALATSEAGSTVTAKTDGFSFYTVEFTYAEKQYVMNGDTTIALSEILDYVGLSGTVSAVSVSAPELFSASNETGEWLVTAHQAFSSTEWMKVVIDGVEYEIVVTDDGGAGTYTVNITESALSWTPNPMSGWQPLVINSIEVRLYDENDQLVVSNSLNGGSKSVTGTVTLTAGRPVHSISFVLKSTQPSFNVETNKSTDLGGGWVRSSDAGIVSGSVKFTATYPAGHSHSWSYTGSGNVITAKCSGSGTCPVGDQTATLSKPANKTYDGTAVTAPTVTKSSEWTVANGLTEPGSVTVSPTNSGDAGTYTASVTVGSATATSSWTINKLNITPMVSMNGWTYGDSAQNPTISGNTGNGAVTYEYKVKDADDSTYSSTRPSNAGDYTVRASVAATTNYNAATATADFTIAKRDVTITADSDSKPYDGTALTKNSYTSEGLATGDSITSVTVTGTQTDVGSSNNVPTDATIKKGTTDVTANYNITYTNGTLTVTQAPNEVTVDIDGWTYGDAPNAPTSTATFGADKVVYTYSDAAEGTFTSTVLTTAGTWYVKATVPGTDNYAEGSATKSFTIAKKALTVTANDNQITYGEEPTANGVTYDGFIDGEDESDLWGELVYTYTYAQYGDVGTYKITPEGLTSSNYTITYASGKLTVNPKTVINPAITLSSDVFPYDEAQAAEPSVTVKDGTDIIPAKEYEVTYANNTAPGDKDDPNAPSATVADKSGGNYILVFYPADKATATFTIIPGQSSIDRAPTAKSNLVYNGGEQELITAGTGLHGTPLYRLDGETWSEDLPKGLDAGTYTVHYMVKGDTNYEDWTGGDVGGQTLTVTIAKAPVTVTADDKTKVYDNDASTDPELTATVTGAVEGETINYTLSRTAGQDAGDYAISVTAGSNPNYNVTTEGGTFTIAKKPLTITADSANKTYDGTPLTKDTYTLSAALSNGDTVAEITVTGTQTDAGTSANVPSGVVIKNGETDKSANYNITLANGELKVAPRSVTLTSASDSMAYDGTALTNSNVTVTGDGFVAGEGATYNVTGTQTLPGSSANAFTYTLNDGTKAGNYAITKTEGVLTVTDRTDGGADRKYEIDIKGNSGTFKYDGEDHEVSGFETLEFTFNNVTYTVTGISASLIQTDAGTYSVAIVGTPVVENPDGVDLTDQFIVNTEPGTLTINKRNVTITSGSASKQFDDEDLTDGTIIISGDDFAPGEGVVCDVTGKQKYVGSSKNSFTYMFEDGTKAENYNITKVEGTLTVADRDTKYEIAPQAKSDAVKYDGQAHEVSGFVTDTFTVDGHTYTVSGLTATGSGTDAGTYTVAVSGTAVVKDAAGQDVTAEFSVLPKAGTLTITKREVSFTSASKSKEYDGGPLTNANVTVGGDGFVEGEGATYTVTGSRTAPGTSENTFNYALNANTKADNYTITKHYGSLTVNHRDAKYNVTLTANSLTDAKYDGTEKTVSGYTIGEAASAADQTCTFVNPDNGKEYTISGVKAELKATNAGTYTVNIIGTPVIVDSEGTDETAEFEVATKPGTLTIAKRDVTLTSATDSKTYDGAALTNEEITVGGDRFVEGEGAHYNFTGTQTLPGESDNTFTYDLDDDTNADNYAITTTFGKLTVNHRSDSGDDKKFEITVKAASKTATYDGQEKEVTGFETLEFTIDGVKYTVEGLSASATGTDAGTYTSAVSGTPVVKNPDGVDLTSEFIVNTENGTLSINKRNITLTSATATKEYDGNALAKDSVAVTGDGFASGEGATYTVTGKQTIPGSSDNHFTYTLNSGTKADNYVITKIEGKLTVLDRDEESKYEIAPQAKSDTVKYDGTSHSVSGLVTDTFTVEGHTYTVSGLSATGSGTDAGTYAIRVSGTPIVKDADDNDVTKEFDVLPKNGTLTITKRDITLTSATDSKTYDGHPLTNDEVTVGGDGFVDGEGATYNVTGTRTTVGTSDNTFTYTLKNGTKADNYNVTTSFGTLTVNHTDTKYEVTLKANSDTQKYDGSAKTVSGYTIGEAESTDGDNPSCTFTASNGEEYTINGMSVKLAATDAGEYTANVIGTPVIKDAGGNNVTEEFAITTESGKLVIEKRNVTLTSATDTKPYDGAALTNDEVSVGGDGWAEGEGAHYTFTGTQTLPGSSDNTFSYDLNAGTLANNYSITQSFGKLTVTDRSESEKYEITLKPKSATFTYDGASHMVSGFEQTEFAFDGKTYRVTGPKATVSGQDAGTYPVEVSNMTSLKVLDADDNDLTKEFIVNYDSANLVINKRNVTLTSATDSKEFNDEPLTNNTVTVSGDGFANGEGATYNVTGSQLVAGSSPNYFTYTLKDGTKAANYNITPVEGTLTVTHKNAKYEVAPQAKSGTFKYDGQTHEVSGFETLEFTIDEHTYTVSGLTAEASSIDVGDYTVKVSGTPVVKDANGNDVTEEFSVQPKSGTLSIEKRSVTLTSASDSKEFDDEPLTNSEVTVSGDGFVEGEGATYKVTGTRTIPGTAENTFDYTLNNGTKANNYDISKAYGTLTVNHKNTKFEVTLTANSGTEKYDGTKKTVVGYKIGDTVSTVEGEQTCTFEQDGHTYTMSGMNVKFTATDAGEYTVNVIGTPVVKDASDNAVTEEFAVKVESGSLKIEKRDVTLTSATDSKAYNGSALTNHNVTVTGDGWAEGEGAHYNVTGTQTLPGTSANSFTYDLNEGTKAANYNIAKTEGTLTVADRVEKYEISLKLNSGQATYDGTEHEASGFETTEFTFDGVKYTVSGVTASAKGTDAGTYPVEVSGEPKVTDPAGNDLTKEFKINMDDANLVIGKRNVTLTSATESKEYDGSPLTNDEIAVSGAGFVAGEGATYTVTGSQTIVGSSANTFTYKLNAGTKADNYNITKTEGTLTVTSRGADEKIKIEPEAQSDTFTYNGKEQKIGDLVTDTFEAYGHTYTVSELKVQGAGTDVGEYPVNVTGTAVVKDENGNDVSSEFNVVPRAGTLTIEKRTVSLTSATDSKEYDGSPLTNDQITVGEDGWAEGEGAAYNVTGTRTFVGTAENSFTYTLNSNTKAENYDVTTSFGTLTVTNRNAPFDITLVANSKTEVYNGAEQTVSGYTIGDATSADDGTCTFTVESGAEYTISGMSAEAKGTDAGSYTANVVGTPFIVDSEGNDMTTQFAVKVESGALTIEPKPITRDMLTVDPAAMKANGSEQGPTFSMADAGLAEPAMTEGTDYTLSGETTSSENGTHFVTVAGKGNYTGTLDTSWKLFNEKAGAYYEEGTGGAGSLEAFVDAKGENISVAVKNFSMNLAKSVLTDEELSRYEEGEDILVYVEVEELAKELVDTADRDAIEAIFADKGATDIVWMDITVWKQIGTEPAKQVHELNRELELSTEVPDDYKSAPSGQTRTLYLATAHDGAGTLLAETQDTTMSFGCSKFSTFALAYKDVASSNGGGEGQADNSTKKAATANAGKGTAKTGDSANLPLLWTAIACTALVTLVSATKLRRRNKPESKK